MVYIANHLWIKDCMNHAICIFCSKILSMYIIMCNDVYLRIFIFIVTRVDIQVWPGYAIAVV